MDIQQQIQIQKQIIKKVQSIIKTSFRIDKRYIFLEHDNISYSYTFEQQTQLKQYEKQAEQFILRLSDFNFLDKLRKICRFITTLSLKNCQIEMLYIYQSRWKFIKFADLSQNNITSDGALILSQCQWGFLQTLLLNHNQLKNKGLAYIFKGRWKNLKVLEFVQNKLTGDCVKMLIKCKFKRLNKLAMFEQNVRLMEQIMQVIKLIHLPFLKLIYLKDTKTPFTFSTYEQDIIQLNQLSKVYCRPYYPLKLEECFHNKANFPSNLKNNKHIELKF